MSAVITGDYYCFFFQNNIVDLNVYFWQVIKETITARKIYQREAKNTDSAPCFKNKILPGDENSLKKCTDMS